MKSASYSRSQVHYHIVPAPKMNQSANSSHAKKPDLTKREMHQLEFEAREELDESEAEALVQDLRARL